ncbi:MAG: alanine racemase [Anaerolineales bacterium]|nr:alanine racemase [Anaerolineales bacterium]MDW8160663.1 alanine racemase [Anaerolineales bacterium]
MPNSSPPYSTWVEVDLQAIRDNVRWIVEHSGVAVMAVVKADGYGHGSVPVARAALQGGATWLGVSRIEEALELRNAGIAAPILVLGYLSNGFLEHAIQSDISLTVWSPKHIEEIELCARQLGRRASVHLKIDSGMGRIGAFPQEAGAIAKQLARAKHLVWEGVYTHFARADENDPAPTQRQLQRFCDALEKMRPYLPTSLRIHAANSAATLNYKETLFNMVRIGIAMYGLNPSPDRPLPPVFKPALSWKTVLSHVKIVPPGEGISYGHAYVTQTNERIGTLPVGYADGFRRVPGNMVLIKGKKVPVVGRVCMDQCMVQLDGVPEAEVGDEVVLIGKQGGQQITADEVAGLWSTINYEVICGIGRRVPRIYLNL